LIALPILPIYVTEEIEGAKQYYIYKERCVFCDIVSQEMKQDLRLIELRGAGDEPRPVHDERCGLRPDACTMHASPRAAGDEPAPSARVVDDVPEGLIRQALKETGAAG
jgi:hypothetical protein